MSQHEFAIALLVPQPGDQEFFDAHLLGCIIDALGELDMMSLESFADKEEEFINKLRVAFVPKFPKGKEINLSGKYHPGFEDIPPRYDMGVRVGTGTERVYCWRVMHLGTPTTSQTFH